MTSKLKLCIMAGGVSVLALGATPAFATGTAAGSSISNVATVGYSVGGVPQSGVTSNTSTFTVDRKIDLLVTEPGNSTFSVTPGQSGAYTTFRVTNLGNATMDFKLTVAQLAGGTAPHTGTDSFDVTGVSLFVDTNGNGTYEAGTDTAITFLDEIAQDTFRTVFVVANVPVAATNGQIAALSLTAQAEAGGTAGTEGAVLTNDSGTANTAGIDNVFADAAGTDDIVRDGRSSARDDYTVTAPVLTVTKQSRIVSDLINGTTNPKYIPGATVEYCIIVANSGTSAANSVAIADTLPIQTTGDTTYGLFQGGTVTAGVCNLDGTAGGTITATAVNGSLGTLAAGTTRSIYFRVTIN